MPKLLNIDLSLVLSSGCIRLRFGSHKRIMYRQFITRNWCKNQHVFVAWFCVVLTSLCPWLICIFYLPPLFYYFLFIYDVLYLYFWPVPCYPLAKVYIQILVTFEMTEIQTNKHLKQTNKQTNMTNEKSNLDSVVDSCGWHFSCFQARRMKTWDKLINIHKGFALFI